MRSEPLSQKLQHLVGEQFDYVGKRWVLIEVLQDLDSLVLRHGDGVGHAAVQHNSYGHPNRRVKGTLTVPISDPKTGGYSDAALLLLGGRLKSANQTV
jgi:hypothetical protein